MSTALSLQKGYGPAANAAPELPYKAPDDAMREIIMFVTDERNMDSTIAFHFERSHDAENPLAEIQAHSVLDHISRKIARVKNSFDSDDKSYGFNGSRFQTHPDCFEANIDAVVKAIKDSPPGRDRSTLDALRDQSHPFAWLSSKAPGNSRIYG